MLARVADHTEGADLIEVGDDRPLVGAIVALALPGRRRRAESVPVGAVPALEGTGGS